MIGKLENPSSNTQYSLERLIFSKDKNTTQIYRATTTGGEHVVIKKLTVGASRGKISELVNELRLCSRFTHTNITRMLDGYIEHHWLVMESMQGDLIHLISDFPLPLGATLSILAQVAKAMQYIQIFSIIHCDIKPENVLFKEIPSISSETRYLVQLTDFGRSIELPKDAKYITLALERGTPPYVAPEVVVAHRYSFASDMYSFGLLAFTLFSRSQPYNMYTVDQLHGFILPSLYQRIEILLIPPDRARELQSKFNLTLMQWDELERHNLCNSLEEVPSDWRAFVINCCQVDLKWRYTIDRVIAALHDVCTIDWEEKLAPNSTNTLPDLAEEPIESDFSKAALSLEPLKSNLHEAVAIEVHAETKEVRPLSSKLSTSRFTLLPAPKDHSTTHAACQNDTDNTTTDAFDPFSWCTIH